jgi:carnitine-CoA ligase
MDALHFPSADECVVARLLDRRAAEHPDRTFAVFDAGRTWTYGDALGQADRVAGVLA